MRKLKPIWISLGVRQSKTSCRTSARRQSVPSDKPGSSFGCSRAIKSRLRKTSATRWALSTVGCRSIDIGLPMSKSCEKSSTIMSNGTDRRFKRTRTASMRWLLAAMRFFWWKGTQIWRNGFWTLVARCRWLYAVECHRSKNLLLSTGSKTNSLIKGLFRSAMVPTTSPWLWRRM